MGALTQTYVDPSIAADSGSGTVGDPYGDLQYALNQITRDGTNGDQINIKAGTEEILAAALTLATYGTPTATAPLIFRGYTSAADDGGEGEIDCNGANLFASSYNYLILKDLDLYNGAGSAAMVNLGTYCVVENCAVHQNSGALAHGVSLSTAGVIRNCHVYDVGGQGITCQDGLVEFCFVENGPSNNCSNAIVCGTAISNLVSVSAASNGIVSSGNTARIENNSVYSAAGSGSGISVAASSRATVLNNVVEGFSAGGGIGIEHTQASSDLVLYGGNACYDNATEYSVTGDVLINLGSNETLASSPFTDAANDDFTPTSTLLALPSSFKGASCYTDVVKGACQEGSGLGTGGGTTTVVVPAVLRRRQPARFVRRRSHARSPVVIAQTITDDSPKIVSPVRKRMVRLIRRPIQHLVCQQVNQTTNVFVENRLIRK